MQFLILGPVECADEFHTFFQQVERMANKSMKLEKKSEQIREFCIGL
jgi:hypothetical protein